MNSEGTGTYNSKVIGKKISISRDKIQNSEVQRLPNFFSNRSSSFKNRIEQRKKSEKIRETFQVALI